MNGKSHAVIGAVAPLSLVMAGADLGQLAALSVVSAGFALGPDVDHPNATATKAWGSSVHRVVHRLSTTVRKATSTSSDRAASERWEALGRDADHRALTHTGLSFLAVSTAVYTLGMLPLGAALFGAVSGWTLGHLVKRSTASIISIIGGALGILCPAPAWMLALAAGAGWLSHVLTDGCTMGGVPLTWPVRRKGRRWSHTRILGRTLRSGDGSDWLITVLSVSVLALPFLATMTTTR